MKIDSLPLPVRIAVGLAGVAVAAGTVKTFDGSLTVATLVVLLAVLGASMFGFWVGVVAAIAGFFALNVGFTPPVGELQISKGDDVVALVVYLIVATGTGAIITTLDRLRRRAERSERETRVRYDLTNRLQGGEDAGEVSSQALEALAPLFDLRRAEVTVAGTPLAGVGEAPLPTDGSEATVVAQSGSVVARAWPAKDVLTADERALLQAVLAALVAAIDRRRLEDAARAAAVSAAIDQGRSAFLTAVTHELRTPLASITAASSVLLHDDDRLEPSQRVEMLETIRDESARLEELVRKVLAAARIRAGAIQPSATPTDVVDVAQAALRRLGPLARTRELRLVTDDDVPTMMVDGVLLEFVLQNLVENALHFAPENTTIDVCARRDGDGVRISVVDHGAGVPEEARERIFEEFVRERDEGRPGAGLGLSIVRALVELHGGAVWYEETPGGGATFVFTVPAAPEEPEP